MNDTHGGDWAAYEMEYGAPPLDFSASLSPLGMPERAKQAAAAALEHAARYPDPHCRALRAALSERFFVPTEQIVCGAGAADLIWRLAAALRPKRAVLPAPTFTEYERALCAFGCEIHRVPLLEKEDFAMTDRFLRAITAETDLVILCQPNNPTGMLCAPALLRRVLSRCAAVGAMLLADECFLDFTEDGDRFSLLPEISNAPQLVILRAFTKTYAMAGLRLGYALCGDASFAERLQRCGQPWSVSAPAEAAGRAALEEPSYEPRLRAVVRRERERMLASLRGLGFRVVPGTANYLLFYSENHALGESLKARGILLRDCAAFPGLGPGWYRAAVRTAAENDLLLGALKEG